MATELEKLAKEMAEAGLLTYGFCLERLERARALGHEEAAKQVCEGCAKGWMMRPREATDSPDLWHIPPRPMSGLLKCKAAAILALSTE